MKQVGGASAGRRVGARARVLHLRALC